MHDRSRKQLTPEGIRFHRPDSGRILINGEETVLRSVDHARSIGIDTVYQDLAGQLRKLIESRLQEKTLL